MCCLTCCDVRYGGSAQSFAKTKFVADVAIAGGAFKRYIYTPAKDGKFKKGANGRVSGYLSDLHGAASQGGAPFTDNTNTSA